MKISIVLLFISFNTINLMRIDGDYSIDPFLREIQSNGIYDLLTEISNSFGNEIAIEVCLQFYQTNDCEKVVNTYIGTSSLTNSAPQNFDFTDEEKIENFQNLQRILFRYGFNKRSNFILFIIAFRLARKFPDFFKMLSPNLNLLNNTFIQN